LYYINTLGSAIGCLVTVGILFVMAQGSQPYTSQRCTDRYKYCAMNEMLKQAKAHTHKICLMGNAIIGLVVMVFIGMTAVGFSG
jgi:hypothetical protein